MSFIGDFLGQLSSFSEKLFIGEVPTTQDVDVCLSSISRELLSDQDQKVCDEKLVDLSAKIRDFPGEVENIQEIANTILEKDISNKENIRYTIFRNIASDEDFEEKFVEACRIGSLDMIDGLLSRALPEVLEKGFLEACKKNHVGIVRTLSSVISEESINKGFVQACTEENKLSMMRAFEGALTGIKNIHAKGYIHQDIKLANMLYKGSKGKVADLGSVSAVEEARRNPELYSSPETLTSFHHRHCFHDQKADVWSFGLALLNGFQNKDWPILIGESSQALNIVFRSLVVSYKGEHPAIFSGLSEGQKKNELNRARFISKRYNEEYLEPADDTIEHLTWGCLRPNPADRPTAAEAIEKLQNIIAAKEREVI